MRLVVQQIYFDDRPVKDIAAELGITHSAVSQQRAEAIRLLRDGLGTHYSDDSDTAYVPESRVAPARRSAYLARLADHAMIGIASLAHDRVPAAIAAISTSSAISAPGLPSKELSAQNG